MEYKGSLYAQGPVLDDWAVYNNNTALLKGAVVVRGTTLGTNLNFAVVGSSALTDVIGVLYEDQAATTAGNDSNAAGTNYTTRQVIVDPFAYFRAEFDQTDTMAVASVGSSTVTVTSGETGLQGGYLYAVSGLGSGRLTVIVTDDTNGVYTVKENLSGIWDNTTVLIKIVPKWHQLIKITTDGTKIGSDAAAGSGTVTVKDIWIQSNSIPLARLRPTLHSGLTGLDLDGVRFFADILFRNHVYNTID